MSGIRGMIAKYLAETANEPEPDEHGRRVLQRIAADTRAHDALNTISKTRGIIWKVVSCCVHAELLARRFPKLLAEEREMVERLRRHQQSVEDLRQFLNQAIRWHEDPIVDWITIPEQESAVYRNALTGIAALIDLRQRTVEDVVLRLGATRKSANKSAAETAAIGWLADWVVHLTGKPFAQQVAVLAAVALDIDEVSEDRVRAALKARIRLVCSAAKNRSNRPMKF
jgi:hypothetical protein